MPKGRVGSGSDNARGRPGLNLQFMVDFSTVSDKKGTTLLVENSKFQFFCYSKSLLSAVLCSVDLDSAG